MSTLFLNAQNDSSVFVLGDKTRDKGFTIHIGSSSKNNGNCIEYFVMTFENDSKAILQNYDVSKWKEVGTIVDFEEDTSFKGIAWMRMPFKISPKYFSKAGIKFDVYGAAIFFLDGKYLCSTGKIDPDPQKEMYINNNGLPVKLLIADTQLHVLSILYSKKRFKEDLSRYSINTGGLELSFVNYEDNLSDSIAAKDVGSYLFMSLFVFFFTLTFVHTLLFVFERDRKFNLYHAVFMLSLSLLFLLSSVYTQLTDYSLASILQYYGGFVIPVFPLALLSVLYSIFKKPFDKFYKFVFLLFILCIVLKFFNEGLYNTCRVTLILSVYFSTLSISIRGVKQNIPGAKIVGLGVIGFTFFILLTIITTVILIPTSSDAGTERGPVFAFFLALCLVFSVISIPISMSVFLAYDFALTNKTLKSQILHIEELNQESIRKEQEKQQILAEQNELLEKQVKERTAELSDKNEILFTQNKEILDSIRYAKRIQQALITHESYILKNFKRLRKDKS